jgi:uncharacterized radical SAM superfamily Fe-S cluster-containing enzyme
MQFDGVDDAVYEKLRRRLMLEVKKRAIEQCGRYGIGVTLVPVIVPGVNTEQIGDILRFAIQRSPYVRGVHFQPVSYFGRIPELPADDDRYTLDELLEMPITVSFVLTRCILLRSPDVWVPRGFHRDAWG